MTSSEVREHSDRYSQLKKDWNENGVVRKEYGTFQEYEAAEWLLNEDMWKHDLLI